MQARRVGVRLFFAVVFAAVGGCAKSTPTSAQVELVGTLTLTRMGDEVQIGNIWTEEGAADLSVRADLDELRAGAVVVGSGTGVAAYDASRSGCTNRGRWDTQYSVTGFLDTEPTCRLTLRVDVRWTNGVASGQCGGITVSQPVPDYSFGLDAIFDNNTHEIHTNNTDGAIDWSNRYQMIRFDSTGVTRCQFNS